MDDPLIQAAMAVVRERLAQHGGQVELLGVNDEGVALVRLEGACRGCAAANATLRNVVEKILTEMAPQIRKVEAVM